MQIKQFYLDLREWPQYAKNNNNVWLLESEAFKEPLKFVFEFDENDNLKLSEIAKECMQRVIEMKWIERNINEKIQKIDEKYKMIADNYQKLEEISAKYDLLLEKIKQKENIIKEKELQENSKIWDLNKQLKLLENRINLPEPQKIYTKIWDEFVVWTDIYYSSPYNLTHWEYIIIEQYEYEPQNEYVVNENKIQIKQEYLSWKYIPEIQLESSNAIDKPVCKVRLTILFFQI